LPADIWSRRFHQQVIIGTGGDISFRFLEHLQQYAKFCLANLVFFQLSKRYDKEKRVHLQQFGIIHLPNLEQLQQFSILSCHYYFFAKRKKPPPAVLHLRLPFIPSWEKPTPGAYICAQLSAAHPSGLEEVDGYKNNFVFSQDSWFKFSRGGRVET
jgi:hypothetical protein